jgi:hypothetical protein
MNVLSSLDPSVLIFRENVSKYIDPKMIYPHRWNSPRITLICIVRVLWPRKMSSAVYMFKHWLHKNTYSFGVETSRTKFAWETLTTESNTVIIAYVWSNEMCCRFMIEIGILEKKIIIIKALQFWLNIATSFPPVFHNPQWIYKSSCKFYCMQMYAS